MSNNRVLYGGDFYGKVAPQFALGVTKAGKIYFRDEKGNWSLFIPSVLPTISVPTLAQVLTASTLVGHTGSIVLTDGTIAVSGGIITGFTPAP